MFILGEVLFGVGMAIIVIVVMPFCWGILLPRTLTVIVTGWVIAGIGQSILVKIGRPEPTVALILIGFGLYIAMHFYPYALERNKYGSNHR